MTCENRQARIPLLSSNPEQQLSHRLSRPSESMHDVNGKIIGVLFGLARIGCGNQRTRGKDHCARASDVAEQQADQKRGTTIIDQVARAITMPEMAEFMGEHAGDLV